MNDRRPGTPTRFRANTEQVKGVNSPSNMRVTTPVKVLNERGEEIQLKKRTLSVESGICSMVTSFYQQKLEEAKVAANKELKSLNEEIIKSIAGLVLNGEDNEASTLEKIKSSSHQILITSTEDCSVKLNGFIEQIVKIKAEAIKNNFKSPQHFINKLLSIIATFSRLIGYLVSELLIKLIEKSIKKIFIIIIELLE